MPSISVIIPVYNVEKYLGRCLDSLLAQTWTDWEALCVDDGSRDASGTILDSYAGRDSRFRVVHVDNGGTSHARNIALDMVGGEFLMLLDSDDFIHPQTMELCMYFARRDSSDLVTFTYHHPYRTLTSALQFLHLPEYKPKFKKYDPSKVETRVTENVFEYATEYSKPDDIDRTWAVKHCHPVRCMYRMEIMDNLRFIEGIIYEDFPWWSSVLFRTRKMTIMRLPLYYYYPNFKGAIISSGNRYKIESLKKALAAAEQICNSEIDSYKIERWKKHFLTPFRSKLEKKLKALK